MNDREKLRLEVSKGTEAYADSLENSRRLGGETYLAWSNLTQAADAMVKVLKFLRKGEEALSEASGRNKKAVDGWERSFTYLIGAGALDSRRDEVRSAVSGVGQERERAQERQPLLDRNLAAIAEFAPAIQRFIGVIKEDVAPELYASHQSGEEFNDHTGPEGGQALYAWERSLE